MNHEKALRDAPQHKGNVNLASISKHDRPAYDRPVTPFPAPRQAAVLLPAVIAGLLVILVYVWFVSVGYWTWWPKTTYTYDLLGSAFRSGQLSLQESPDPALLALPNPYDPTARTGLQYPWDASLYRGKYYLYWGPTPGLTLAVIKLFYSGQIADQYLVFAFILGIFLFSGLLLLFVRQRYFRADISAGAIFLGLLAVGLVGPATWLLNRPAGYEAAIAGGQFFLVAGLYFAVSASWEDPPSIARLILAGCCWSLAVGSRASTAFPIAFMTAIIVLRLFRKTPAGAPLIRSIASLGVPLMVGAASLAWYNWARFGSPIEFGLRYQLTLLDLNAKYAQAFSLGYIPDNLHNYLANAVAISRTFPFLTPLNPARLPAGPALAIPTSEVEPVTGLLVSSPFLVFALVPLVMLIARPRQDSGAENASAARAEEGSPRWLYVCLLGSAAISFLFILSYFYPTMRQLEDVVPVLSVLAVLGLWEGCLYLRLRPTRLALLATAASVIILISILASSLLAVTSYDNRFQHLNRELLRQLIHFFGR